MRRRNPISLLRTLAMIEGASFLVLLFVAMPLKYFAGVPMAVKVVGWIHGVLFAVVVMALVWTMIAARWPIARGALVFAAALVPFGPFVIDRRMREYADDFEVGGGDEQPAQRPV
jgi:integral membrane protein